MNFIADTGYDVKQGKQLEFQEWLTENEEKLAASCPSGTEYLGTFANIFGSERSVGTYRTLWGMDSYAAMDAFSAAIKEGGTFAQLMDTMGRFVLDRQDGGVQSGELSRRVSDAAMWGVD